MATTLALPSDIVNWTPTDKAGYYNTLLSQGYTDADIRAAAGTQTDADWQALQSIAASLQPASTTIDPVAAYNAAVSSAGSSPATTLSTNPDSFITVGPQIKDYTGSAYDWATIQRLAGQIAPLFDTSRSSGGFYGTTQGSAGFDFAEAARLLGRDPTPAEQVVLDMARYLNQSGVTDISQLRPGGYEVPGYELESGTAEGYTAPGLYVGDTLVGRAPGRPGMNYNSAPDYTFGTTYTGEGGTNYRIDYSTGQPRFYTTGFSTSDADAIAPLLLIGALVGAPYLGSLFGGASAAGAGAGLGATELAIAAAEGIIPVTAAQTATAGLTAAQLGALGSGIGLAGATPVVSGLFNAAADSQLANEALAAAGIDPLSGYLATGATPSVVNIGGSLYGVSPEAVAAAAAETGLPIGGSTVSSPTTITRAADSQMANEAIAASGGNPLAGYVDPTLAPSVVNVNGSLYGTNPAAVAQAAAETGLPVGGSTTSGLTDTLTKFLTNPSNLQSLLSLLSGGAGLMSGGGGAGVGVGTLPTQGIPQNTPEYYNQVQGFLNQYIPGQMPTQAQYLANWYGSQSGMLPTITEGSPVVRGTATTIPTTTTVLPTTTTTTLPTTTAAASSPLTAQQAADYYRSTVGRGLMSERDLVNELRAIGVPDSIMTQAQGLLSGGNAAPVYDKTYTATDIREAIQQTLKADPNVRKEDLKILAATTYGVDPFEFDRQWIEVAGNKFIDKYANTTDPIIRELVNNMRETKQIYENSSNAAAVNAAQNAAIAADLANPNFNATPADIAEAYRQSVGAGTMTETDFVNRALAMGATPSDLTAAQNILLGR